MTRCISRLVSCELTGGTCIGLRHVGGDMEIPSRKPLTTWTGLDWTGLRSTSREHDSDRIPGRKGKIEEMQPSAERHVVWFALLPGRGKGLAVIVGANGKSGGVYGGLLSLHGMAHNHGIYPKNNKGSRVVFLPSARSKSFVVSRTRSR